MVTYMQVPNAEKLEHWAGRVYKAFHPITWTPKPLVGTLKDAIRKQSGFPSAEAIAGLEQAIKEYKQDMIWLNSTT